MRMISLKREEMTVLLKIGVTNLTQERNHHLTHRRCKGDVSTIIVLLIPRLHTFDKADIKRATHCNPYTFRVFPEPPVTQESPANQASPAHQALEEPSDPLDQA